MLHEVVGAEADKQCEGCFDVVFEPEGLCLRDESINNLLESWADVLENCQQLLDYTLHFWLVVRVDSWLGDIQ